MESSLTELRYKEIISIADGCRYGTVNDARFDLTSGCIRGLVVRGRLRLFGLLGREEDLVFPWDSIRQIGEDIILVERLPERRKRESGPH